MTTKDRARLKNTGMPPEVYRQLVAEQDGKCAICGKKMHTAHTDHDHNMPGVFRELLCNRCNAGLAAIEDVEFRTKALEYLERHNWVAT
jgi:hypothetical protein